MTLELEAKVNDNQSTICNVCNSENSLHAKFCSDCGEQLLIYQVVEKQQAPLPDRKLFYSNHIYAGFLKRLGALIVDLIALFIGFYSVYVASDSSSFVEFFSGLLNSTYFYVACWLYFLIMDSHPIQGTLGKHLLKIHVCNQEGEPISLLHNVFRHVCMLITVLTAGLGYLLILFTEHTQSLHDFLADTLVVNSSTSSTQIKMINHKRRTYSRPTIITFGVLSLVVILGGVFHQQISEKLISFNANDDLAKLEQQNNQLQHALVRFHQKAGKWPANIKQLDEYIGVVKQPGIEFIITGQGNYQQLYRGENQLNGKIVIWQKYQGKDQQWHWRCSSTDIDLKQTQLSCHGS